MSHKLSQGSSSLKKHPKPVNYKIIYFYCEHIFFKFQYTVPSVSFSTTCHVYILEPFNRNFREIVQIPLFTNFFATVAKLKIDYLNIPHMYCRCDNIVRLKVLKYMYGILNCIVYSTVLSVQLYILHVEFFPTGQRLIFCLVHRNCCNVSKPRTIFPLEAKTLDKIYFRSVTVTGCIQEALSFIQLKTRTLLYRIEMIIRRGCRATDV